MPVDLKPFIGDATRCAVVVFECQKNVIEEGGPYPGLVTSVQSSGLVATLAAFLASARKAGARVVYCTAGRRAGGLAAARVPGRSRVIGAELDDTPGSTPEVVDAIKPEPGDVVVRRYHGMSGFHDTGLDPCLRHFEVRTVIPVGVSLNVGLLGTTIEAVNRGYRVALPTDCAVSDPPEYAEQVLRYSFRNLAFLTSSAEVARIWGVG